MDFTELTNQIDDAINNQSSEKQKALETLDKQLQVIVDWTHKFVELTKDTREFGKTLQKPMGKFPLDATDSRETTNLRSGVCWYDAYRRQEGTCFISAERSVTHYDTKFRFFVNNCGSPFELDISEDFINRIKEGQSAQNYPEVLTNRFCYREPTSKHKANFLWTLVNNISPEEVADVYTTQTITIAKRFIESIRNSNSALADAIEKAAEELKAYYEKNTTSVTENEDGSVEIQINGKTYIGTVKEA
jgi:hypothetical protein